MMPPRGGAAKHRPMFHAVVLAIGPRLGAPVINRLDALLVTGPWLAGVTGVVAALNERLPEHRFVEATDLAAGEAPTAVVFVVSGSKKFPDRSM